MILKSITVGNFKNIDLTTFDLRKMISLISVNNYGKSNLIDAIRFGFDFITASAKVRNAMMRWIKGIPLVAPLADKDFTFSIEFEDASLNEYRYVRYGYSFSWVKDDGSGAVITDESLEIRSNESVRYTSYLKRNSGKYKAGKSKTGFRNITLAKDILAIDIISSLDNVEISNVVTAIKSIGYRMCNSLELDDSYHPGVIEFGFTSDSKFPLDDNDIPRALNVLNQKNPQQFTLFLETIYDLFPEFKEIKLQSYTLKEEESQKIKALIDSSASTTTTSQDHEPKVPYRIRDEIYRLIIQSVYLNQPISMEHMSTGTKRIFWLIANAIFGESYGINLLGVDEIETSIHPRMTKNLLESLNDILGAASMILTSHSPYIIQYLKPEYIYIGVPNDQGLARFKRIQPSKIKNLLNLSRDLEISIGEYLFELMSGDKDSADILLSYLED